MCVISWQLTLGLYSRLLTLLSWHFHLGQQGPAEKVHMLSKEKSHTCFSHMGALTFCENNFSPLLFLLSSPFFLSSPLYDFIQINVPLQQLLLA